MTWVKLARDEGPAYAVSVPDGAVILTYTRPRARPDRIDMALLDPDGNTVGSWGAEVYDPEDPRDDSDEDWDLLKSLLSESHRRVTGWDRVVTGIEKALASPGPIGAPSPPKRFADASGLAVTSSAAWAQPVFPN